MLKKLWDAARRFRTWIFNVLAAVVLFLPDLVNAFAGFNWGTVVPPQYMPYVTVAVIVVNVLMRPRPAVLPHDPEAQRNRDE